MYIETNHHYAAFKSDELTNLLEQVTFKINNFGIWQSDQDRQVDYITNDIEIIYYLHGGSITNIGNRKYTCPPGSFLILEPYQLNSSINKGYEHYAYYFFHFEIEPLYLKEQFMTLLTKNGHLIYGYEMKNFQEMFNRLLIEAKDKEIGYSSIITSALIRVIVEIIRAQLKRTGETSVEFVHSSHTNLVNESIQSINEHIYESIRLTDMAQNLGVSSSVLYKAFIKVLGISPISYIQKQKINYTQKRLLMGESLTNIAQELGYSSAYHLSRTFKQKVGISPREYKQKMKSL